MTAEARDATSQGPGIFFSVLFVNTLLMTVDVLDISLELLPTQTKSSSSQWFLQFVPCGRTLPTVQYFDDMEFLLSRSLVTCNLLCLCLIQAFSFSKGVLWELASACLHLVFLANVADILLFSIQVREKIM